MPEIGANKRRRDVSDPMEQIMDLGEMPSSVVTIGGVQKRPVTAAGGGE